MIDHVQAPEFTTNRSNRIEAAYAAMDLVAQNVSVPTGIIGALWFCHAEATDAHTF